MQSKSQILGTQAESQILTVQSPRESVPRCREQVARGGGGSLQIFLGKSLCRSLAGKIKGHGEIIIFLFERIKCTICRKYLGD